MVMIDINVGGIIVNNDNSILSRGLTKKEFEESNLYKEVIRCDEYGYTRYILNPQLIDNDYFAIGLIFNPDNMIEFISINIVYNDNSSRRANWSEERELRRKKEHDKWLLKNIGDPPYEYSWGGISSDYDPRSGSSSITIRYYV